MQVKQSRNAADDRKAEAQAFAIGRGTALKLVDELMARIEAAAAPLTERHAVEAGVAHLDLAQINDLSFHEPDLARFPCLQLAFRAMQRGDSAPAVLNAANEVAVENFLEGRIGFDRIPGLVAAVMEQVPLVPLDSLDESKPE